MQRCKTIITFLHAANYIETGFGDEGQTLFATASRPREVLVVRPDGSWQYHELEEGLVHSGGPPRARVAGYSVDELFEFLAYRRS